MKGLGRPPVRVDGPVAVDLQLVPIVGKDDDFEVQPEDPEGGVQPDRAVPGSRHGYSGGKVRSTVAENVS
jgi:hypothetical protein